MSKHGKDEGESTIAALARAVRAQPHPTQAALGQAKLLLLDTIGCGIAGAGDETTQAVRDATLDGDKGNCALIGISRRTGMATAALVNGVAVRVLDFNDYLMNEAKGQPEAGGHPSDNIPVALAVGSARARSGGDVLAAVVLGYELYARLQRLMDRAGPWDGVTASGLVAPAIAGRLMHLDEPRLAHALALGLSRAATPAIVRSGHISAAKSLSNALVAQAGVQAAAFAEHGLTGPLGILDAKRGLGDLFRNAEIAALTAPIPTEGATLRAHVKAYPCINTGQAAVAAALAVHQRLAGHRPASVEIVMADYPIVERQQTDPARTRPQSREAADHSFPFIVAAALHDGQFGTAQYANERWHAPEITALMERTVMRRDAAWNTRAPGTYPCTVRAWDETGREHVVEVPYPPGFSRDRLDAGTVLDKFHAVTEDRLDKSRRDQIVDAVMEFEHSRTTARLDAAIAIEETVS